MNIHKLTRKQAEAEAFIRPCKINRAILKAIETGTTTQYRTTWVNPGTVFDVEVISRNAEGVYTVTTQPRSWKD